MLKSNGIAIKKKKFLRCNPREARINSQIELAARRSEESAALAQTERSKRSVVAAEEEIKREKQRLAAESEGIIAALKVEQDAAVELERVKGNATAAMITAENEDRIASLENERRRMKTEVEVEKRSAMIAAENEISASLMGMKLEEQRLRIMPEIAAKMAQPLEKIGNINISHVSGLSNNLKDGQHNGGLGSAVDDVLDLAFRMPAIRRLGEAVGAQISPETNGESNSDKKNQT